MFRHLADALWPAGWLVAQCGGAGTIASILRAVDQVQPGLARGTYFAAPEREAFVQSIVERLPEPVIHAFG